MVPGGGHVFKQRTQRAKSMENNSNSEHGTELFYLLDRYAAALRPISYLEVGVREGDSLRRVLYYGAPARLYLVDDWGLTCGGTGRGNHDHIAALLQECYPMAKPVYLDGNSHVSLPTLATTFQLITVDGDHTETGAALDLRDCWPLLEPNGFLVFDDLYHPTHPYLDAVLDHFVATTPDARLVQKLKWPGPTSGCAVLQKVRA